LSPLAQARICLMAKAHLRYRSHTAPDPHF
jgi:hypothetical protein